MEPLHTRRGHPECRSMEADSRGFWQVPETPILARPISTVPTQVHRLSLEPGGAETKPRVWGTNVLSRRCRQTKGSVGSGSLPCAGRGGSLNNAHSLALDRSRPRWGPSPPGLPACVTGPLPVGHRVTRQVPHGGPCVPDYCISLSGSYHPRADHWTPGAHRDPHEFHTTWTHIRGSARTTSSLHCLEIGRAHV